MVRKRIEFHEPLAHGQIADRWRPDRTYKDTGGEWREYAECIGADPRLFTLESPEETGLTGAGLNRKYNEDKFKIAWTYCDNCQVKSACRIDSYARRDNETTVRGGMNPYDVVPTGEPGPTPRVARQLDMPAAWAAYIKGLPMGRVRRAAHAPESGPWPEWEPYLTSMLSALPPVAWSGPGGRTLEGWQLYAPYARDKTAYVVRHRGDAYERVAVPRGDLWSTL